MAITRENVETAFKELGITVESDGKHFLHSTAGRHAPLIHSILTIDEDGTSATFTTTLSERIASEKRPVVYELLNLVHGQSLWNVRFHLDDTGRVFSIGKVQLWGRPFNGVQFGDIFFSLLVTTDRLFPCIIAVNEEGLSAEDAFERFFMKPAQSSSESAEDEGSDT
jgi:hypothetical protein